MNDQTLIRKISDTFSRYWFSASPENQYSVSNFLFVRGLPLIYFVKFLSIAPQVLDWIGSGGELPVAVTLNRAKDQLSILALLKYPTFFWYGSNDFFIHGLIWIAIFSATLCFSGFNPGAFLAILYLSFLSLTSVGGNYFSSPGSRFLLEAGFLAMFFTSFRKWLPFKKTPTPPTAFRLLYWALVLRVFLGLMTHEIEKIGTDGQSAFHLWIYTPLSLLFSIEAFGSPKRRREAAFGLMITQLLYIPLGLHKGFATLVCVSSLLYLDDSWWLARLPAFATRIEHLAGNKYRGFNRTLLVVAASLVGALFFLSAVAFLPIGHSLKFILGEILSGFSQFGLGQPYTF